MNKVIPLFFIKLIMTGCAAQVSKAPKLSDRKTITSPAEQIIILIRTYPEYYVQKSSDLTHAIAKLNDLLRNNIESQIPHSKVYFKPGHQENVGMNISIESFRHVSNFERFATGILVGDAMLRLKIKIIDLQTDRVIDKTTFNSASETMHGIFGATTPRQVEAMADAVTKHCKGYL